MERKAQCGRFLPALIVYCAWQRTIPLATVGITDTALMQLIPVQEVL